MIRRILAIGMVFNLCVSSSVIAGISHDERKELRSVNQTYQHVLTEELADDDTIDEVLRFGMLRNAALRSAFYQWKASTHEIGKTVSLEDPQIAYKFFIDEIQTRVGPQQEMYSASQVLPFPGKLSAKGDAATAASRQKYADYQKAKLQYLYEVKDAYLEYWYLRKNILVTEKNMELLKRFEGVAQSKFKSSLTSNQDLLKAQVELGKLENELLTLNDYRNPVVSRLNAVLNRDMSLPIAWPNEINHVVLELEKNYVFELFLKNNPDLIKSAQRIEETKKKVWLARLDYLPDFMIGYDYIRTDKRPLTMLNNGDDSSAVMVRMNVPLWFGKQRSQLEEARATEEASTAAKVQIKKDLSSKIETILFRLKDAQRQIQLYRNALVPKAEQSLKASETAYSSGNIDFLNLIDSERTLLNFQLSYYKAIRDYEQRLAEVEMMIGESLRGINYEE